MCEIDIGIRKHEIGSGTKLYDLFEFKGFSTWRERKTQSFYADFSICPPHTHHMRHPAANNWSGLSKSWKSTFFLRGKNSTNCFFSNLSPVLDVTHIPRSYILSGISIVTSLNDTSALWACEHLRSCLHLTNPCTEPKGSQPN